MEKEFGLSKEEYKILKGLNTPKKIQGFVSKLKVNFEYNGETCMSPRRVLREGKAHCVEAAMLAALCLRLQGEKPLVVDLTATKDDFDHVICVFKREGKWGAISKSNHLAHRYREPIYRDIRELVMSIFHEWFDARGRKTLRSFSDPVDLSRFDYLNWETNEENVWDIPAYLGDIKHYSILNRKQIAGLRKADEFEIKLGNTREEEPVSKK